MLRLTVRALWSLRCLLAAFLFTATAATAICQQPPYAGSFATSSAAQPNAAPVPDSQKPAPAPVVAQYPGYRQPGPMSPNYGQQPYPPQSYFPPRPPGYGPMAPPPQTFGGPPALPPPNFQPPYFGSPVPTGPPPMLVPPPAAKLVLPDMVYLVTSKFWFRPDVLLWTTKSTPVPQTLLTTGGSTDAVPGALGQPGTQTIVGGRNYGFGYIGGVRFETGVWFDPKRIFGAEAGYFVLIQQSSELSQQSDPFGNPVIARPTIDAQTGTEGSYIASLPGSVVGGVDVILRSEFQGANVDGVLNLLQTSCVRLDGLAGFRYLSLADSLNINDNSTDTYGHILSFGGAPLAAGDMLATVDRFHVTNSFYGGSCGARLYYAQERWFITALGKAALGTVQERATVSGTTMLTNQNGIQTTLPGGILATTANIGSYYQHAFAVAPEGHLNVGYQIAPWATVRIGYTFIYLSNVARPGDLTNRVTNAGLVPSDPSYGAAGTKPPAIQFHTTNYWAQGLNFGIDMRF